MRDRRLQTACFTGHRQINEKMTEVESRLRKVVEDLVQAGYLYFGAGGARGFDALASEVVLKLKEQYPEIHLILVLPFDRQYEHERDWKQGEKQYYRLREQASKVVMLSSGYSSGIYYKRNRHLVDHSSICVAYMTRRNSGTSYTVSYASAKGVKVTNIADI